MYAQQILIPFALLAFACTESSGQTFQELHAFTCRWDDNTGWDCSSEGVGPQSPLVQAKDGNFYGTTTGGGRWGCGTVFKITTEGVFTTLAHFDGTNGCFPYGALFQASDGNFYGTTMYGRGRGNTVRITPAGAVSDLSAGVFSADVHPLGDLAEGPDGRLYVAAAGGSVFRLSTNGVFELLHLFVGPDGSNPSGGLLLASDGNFYGVTSLGGAEDTGTVYRIGTNGDFVTLASFRSAGGDARYPRGRLVQGSDGSLYGAAGGVNSTIFKVTLDGTLSTFDRFDGWDGDDPVGGLIQARDGYIYGVANEGGGLWRDHGTVFRFAPGIGCTDHTWNPCGYLSLVVKLGVPDYGSYNGALVEGNDGNLYGTTQRGGAQGGGNVYRILMPGPLLSSAQAGHNIVLSWRTNYTGYVLQSSRDLQRGEWIDCTNAASINGGQYFVTNSIPGSSRYFRLKKISQ
jgi:uncharacterized repeat protein (TIGR03803 family)